MSKKLKKSLAILLSCCMVITMSITAFAEGSSEAHGTTESIGTYGDLDSYPIPWLLTKELTKVPYFMNQSQSKMQTEFSVYLEVGDTLLFGAGWDNKVDGLSEDIIFCDSTGAQISGTYTMGNMSRNLTESEKTNLSWETTTYNPYTYTATETGFYTLQFPGGKIQSNHADMYTLYWDATVVKNYSSTGDADTFSFTGTVVEGRMFTQFLSMSAGAKDPALPEGSIYYILTNDGYTYSVDLSGIKPYGFYMFSDAQGVQLVDEDGNMCGSAYQSYKADSVNGANEGNQADITGEHFTVANQSSFYRIFFNAPDADLVNALKTKGEVTERPTTITVENFNFNGGKAVYQGVGGDFSFTSNVAGNYEITIDFSTYTTDYTGTDNGGKVVLRGYANAGTTTVHWDGKDANGNVVKYTKDNKYTASMEFKVGEVHMPLIDVEDFGDGIDLSLVNAPSGYENCVYYNNSHIGGASETTAVTKVNAANILSGVAADTLVIDMWTFAEKKDATDISVIIDIYTADGTVTNGDFEGESEDVPTDQDYVGKVVPDTNFELPDSVKVTVGDTTYTVTDGTPTNGITYDKTTGEVTVPQDKITGDIVVEAECVAKDIGVTVIYDTETNAENESGVTIVSNTKNTLRYNDTYKATITPDSGCKITTFDITIGTDSYTVDPTTGKVTDASKTEVPKITYNPTTGELVIDGSKTTGEVIITVESEPYKVTNDVGNGSYSGDTEVTPGDDYVGTITPDTDYELPNKVKVTVGDDTYIVEDGTPNNNITYDKTTGTVTVPKDEIDGDIHIEADCLGDDIGVTVKYDNETNATDGSGVTIVPDATNTLKAGDSYTATITPDSNCKITKFDIEIGSDKYKVNPTTGKVTDAFNTDVPEITYVPSTGRLEIDGIKTVVDILITVESQPITNIVTTTPPVEQKDDVPDTGDKSNNWFWLTLMILSGGAVIFLGKKELKGKIK